MPLGELSKYIDEEIQKRDGGPVAAAEDESEDEGDEELPLYKQRSPVSSLQVDGTSDTTAQRFCYSCGKATGYCYEQMVARKSICLPVLVAALILLFLGWVATSGYEPLNMSPSSIGSPPNQNGTFDAPPSQNGTSGAKTKSSPPPEVSPPSSAPGPGVEDHGAGDENKNGTGGTR